MAIADADNHRKSYISSTVFLLTETHLKRRPERPEVRQRQRGLRQDPRARTGRPCHAQCRGGAAGTVAHDHVHVRRLHGARQTVGRAAAVETAPEAEKTAAVLVFRLPPVPAASCDVAGGLVVVVMLQTLFPVHEFSPLMFLSVFSSRTTLKPSSKLQFGDRNATAIIVMLKRARDLAEILYSVSGEIRVMGTIR